MLLSFLMTWIKACVPRSHFHSDIKEVYNWCTSESHGRVIFMFWHSSRVILISFTKCLIKKQVSNSHLVILGARLFHPQLPPAPLDTTWMTFSRSKLFFSAYTRASQRPIVFPAILTWFAILVCCPLHASQQCTIFFHISSKNGCISSKIDDSHHTINR